MTIWAICAVVVILAARMMGMSPAGWPGAYAVVNLLYLMPY